MISNFGTTTEDEQVVAGRISAHGLTATILSWGATLQDLRLDSTDQPLVLGFTSFDDYLTHGMFHGATVGRVINRIGGASATIDGTLHHLDSNIAGGHTLHGGRAGYAARNWRVLDLQTNEITLGLTDPHGHMGFPGTVEARCRYVIHEGDRNGEPSLRIELQAETDAPTLVNMGHHSYFCLDNSGDVRGHHLQINAERYLAADATSLPTGDICKVADTPFDFRYLRPVADSFDHNFCLGDARRELTPVAHLTASDFSLSMRILTTEPGLQIYTGHGLTGGGTGHAGHATGPFAGICLEPQFWPDAPHNAAFPRIDLLPGDRYQQVTEFSFSHR